MIEGGCLQASSFFMSRKRLSTFSKIKPEKSLCNCSPFFAATIAQKGRFMQLLALFRANNCTAGAEGNAFRGNKGMNNCTAGDIKA
jgi:hypothetical protein